VELTSSEIRFARRPKKTFLQSTCGPILKTITIHTDGACEGNPGPGGWGAILRYGDHVRELAGGEPATTNNRMELQAAISALAALKEECEVVLFTDSEYLRQGITEWLPRWRANNWRTVDRKPVKNEDLWRQLYETASSHRVTWKWLKGHAGHAQNERCDQLAREEVVKLRRHHSPEKLAELRNAFMATRAPNANQARLL
jgi:ribonuclease HI